MERNLLPNIIDPILDQAAKSFKENDNTITDDILLALYGVFNKVLHNALQLVEANSVTLLKLKSSSGTTDELLQVSSSSGSSYQLFHRVNYCQCVFYRQKVIHAKAFPACKHFIAVNLAYIWNKYRTFEINFNNFKQIIDDIKKTDPS